MKEAYDYLVSLDIDSVNNALWNYFHKLIWHYGIDRVGWILNNKELIEEIIKYDDSEKIPKEIEDKYWESVKYYKNLN